MAVFTKTTMSSKKKFTVKVLVLLSITDTCFGNRAHQPRFEHERHFFDLTHPYDERMPVRENTAPLEMSPNHQDEGNGARSEYFDFCTSEKLGTHINAPRTYLHRNESHSVEKIPLKLLINLPGVVIDLPASEDGEDRSVMLTRQNLEEWEKEQGKIPHGAFVILRTGWSVFFKLPDKFFGNFADEERQMFPGFSEDAVSWLLDARGIAGLGTECADIELPWKTKQAVKQLLAAANRYSVVQLAHVDHLPVSGFDVTIAPLKMRGGSGGPTRVLAALHNNNNRHPTPPEQPMPAFHTESSPKVRRVEPREESPRSFRSEESTPPPGPVVFFSAEEYHNDSAKISTSFISVSLSTLAILILSIFSRHF